MGHSQAQGRAVCSPGGWLLGCGCLQMSLVLPPGAGGNEKAARVPPGPGGGEVAGAWGVEVEGSVLPGLVLKRRGP